MLSVCQTGALVVALPVEEGICSPVIDTHSVEILIVHSQTVLRRAGVRTRELVSLMPGMDSLTSVSQGRSSLKAFEARFKGPTFLFYFYFILT